MGCLFNLDLCVTVFIIYLVKFFCFSICLLPTVYFGEWRLANTARRRVAAANGQTRVSKVSGCQIVMLCATPLATFALWGLVGQQGFAQRTHWGILLSVVAILSALLTFDLPSALFTTVIDMTLLPRLQPRLLTFVRTVSVVWTELATSQDSFSSPQYIWHCNNLFESSISRQDKTAKS